jgi:osmotically-inducible protein OsmY
MTHCTHERFLKRGRAVLLGGLLIALPAFPAPQANGPDAYVTSRTKLALWTTTGVHSSAVHVDTVDGLVTLYGKVPTREQRSVAEKTARQVPGVRRVKNLLQVVPDSEASAVARSDSELKALAEGQLRADKGLADTKISVKSVDKGVVLLTGEASSFSENLRAVVDVDRIPGVKRIASEVKTPADFREDERIIFLGRRHAASAPAAAEPEHGGASDSRISVEVKVRLLTAAQIPSTEISVDTDNAEVTLFGIVPTAEVKLAAGQEAAKVKGVRQVDNELEVVSSASKKLVDARDADITRDLALTFKGHPEFKDIASSVKNGAVRLTGTVPSGWDQLKALRVSHHVTGVRAVEDDLKLDDSAS